MGEVEFNKAEDDYKVKIVDGGDIKEPGGAIRKPTQEEIDAYRIHRLVVMVVFGIVVIVLLLVVVIMIATIDRCEDVPTAKKNSWWKNGVIYNIYPRSFKDSGNDGVGDFKGISNKLDYLKDLGVNILYLSSVFKIDEDNDYGYAVVDFRDVNPQYGTMNDFQQLLDNAHKKNMKIVIEFIPNDTSLKHKWFLDSLNSSSAKKDWYIWQDAVTNTSQNDTCWAKHKENNKFYFYYCKYGNETGRADLNWENVDVQKEMESTLGFWLDKGVDGFRLVSVARMFDNLNPPSNDLTKIHSTLNKWHNYTRGKKADSMLMGASHGASTDYYGTSDRPELDIVVNFALVSENDENMTEFYTAGNFKSIIDKYVGDVPEGKWPSWALTSWVHKRVGTNVSPALAKALNVVLLTLPGTPIVFYGDEIGMVDVTSNQQPRDGNKAPMQWSKDKNGGFSGGNPWFGTVGNSSAVNAKDDQHGFKELFVKTVDFRADNVESLVSSDLKKFKMSVMKDTVMVFTMDKADPQFLVVTNFAKTEKTVDLSKFGKEGDVKLSSSLAGKNNDIKLNAVKVKGEEALIIKIDD